jgi:hypothetical protein
MPRVQSTTHQLSGNVLVCLQQRVLLHPLLHQLLHPLLHPSAWVQPLSATLQIVPALFPRHLLTLPPPAPHPPPKRGGAASGSGGEDVLLFCMVVVQELRA